MSNTEALMTPVEAGEEISDISLSKPLERRPITKKDDNRNITLQACTGECERGESVVPADEIIAVSRMHDNIIDEVKRIRADGTMTADAQTLKVADAVEKYQQSFFANIDKAQQKIHRELLENESLMFTTYSKREFDSFTEKFAIEKMDDLMRWGDYIGNPETAKAVLYLANRGFYPQKDIIYEGMNKRYSANAVRRRNELNAAIRKLDHIQARERQIINRMMPDRAKVDGIKRRVYA